MKHTFKMSDVTGDTRLLARSALGYDWNYFVDDETLIFGTDSDATIKWDGDSLEVTSAITNFSGRVYSGGRITETLTTVNDDSQNMTLAAADIKAGINIHTTATGGGTVTVDTAANIIANVPLTADNECCVSYYINDGDQTATFAVASGTTISDVGNTVPTNTAATLLWQRTSSTAVVLHILQ